MKLHAVPEDSRRCSGNSNSNSKNNSRPSRKRSCSSNRMNMSSTAVGVSVVVSCWLCLSLVLVQCQPLFAFDVARTPAASRRAVRRQYAPDATVEAPVAPSTVTLRSSAPPLPLLENSGKKRKVVQVVQRSGRKQQQAKQTARHGPVASALHRQRDEEEIDDDDEEDEELTLAASATSSSSVVDPEKLLTKEQEMKYAYQLRTMRMVIRMRDELVKHSQGMYIHPTEQEWASACGFHSVQQLRQLMTDGQQARSILCSANVGLVTSLAKRQYANLKYATQAGNGSVGTIMTLSDLIQEGNLGLMEAAERFDPTRGFRFSTYAVWWIRQRIFRSIRDSSRTIRLPAHVHGMLHKIKKARLELQQQQQYTPTVAQIANKLQLPVEKILYYTESSRNVVSLEVPVLATRTFQQDSRTLGDTLASDAPTPEEDVQAEYLRKDVWNVIHTELSPLEQKVILHRFGFLTQEGKPRSVAQTAALLSLTADRVRLMEARALNKLRHPQKNYRLREYVNTAAGGGGSGSDCGGGSFTSATTTTRGRAAYGLVKQRRNMRNMVSTTTGTNTGATTAPASKHKVTTIRKVPKATPASVTVPPQDATTKQQRPQPVPRLDRMWFF